VTETVAQRTQVCAYDRAGTGESSRAPDHARGLDDVVGDLHELLARAAISPPYVMAGAVTGSVGDSMDDPESQKVWLAGASQPGR
jgi:alpha-beta hydrolase superfamily lysophospholipase